MGTRNQHTFQPGRVVAPVTREKLSAALLGHTVAPATRAKLSTALRGRRPWNEGRRDLPPNQNSLGYTHTPEARQAIGDFWRGRERPPFTDEHRAKLRASRTRYFKDLGHVHSEDCEDWSQVMQILPSLDGLECVYCGKPATTRDHVIPRMQGGTYRDGIVPACGKCNSSKMGRTPEQWLAAGLYAS